METISVYLDNMFAGLTKTPDTERLKQELFNGMEEKYMELKQEGKSENEAIGIVISEFGNIEELIAELDIPIFEQGETFPMLSEKEANDYMDAKRSSGLWSGLGFCFGASGVAFLLVFIQYFQNHSMMSEIASRKTGSMLGMIGMFVLFAIAIGMFIYSGMKLDGFKKLEQGFQLPFELKIMLQRNQDMFARTYRLPFIAAVILCVLSPALIFGALYINHDFVLYGVAASLLLAGAGIYLFIYYGSIQGAYAKLLEEPHITAKKKEEERISASVGAVVWGLATAAFLILGFVYQRWDINWLIYPITGILYGVFINAYKALQRKNVS